MVFSADITLAEKLLDVATFRHNVIAHNISNANTPNFKRSEVSFDEALATLMREDENKGGTDLTLDGDPRNLALDTRRSLNQLRAESSSDLGISYAKSNSAFDYNWYASADADYKPPASEPPRDKASIVKNMQPDLIVDKSQGRLDGNNVAVDLEIGKMIKNTTLYNVLVSNISTEFRILKNIITMR